MSDRIQDLLHEVADGVDPGDRLDAIRAETSGGRRTGRGWWAAGGVGLVAASVVTAVLLSTGGTPSSDPDPAQPAPTSPSETATDPVSPEPTGAETSPVGVYYVGDTPDGPRLYRERRSLPGDPLDAAVSAAVGNDTNGVGLLPLDPDYRTPWPSVTQAGASLSPEGDLIEIDLGGDPEGNLHDRGDLSRAEAQLAVEQLIRTAQGVVGGERLPVRFLLYGEITDQVLGVPTSEPLSAGSDLAVLAHVSLTAPAEGQVVPRGGGLIVDGFGNSFEGTIVITIQRWEGTEVVAEVPTIAGTYEDRLFPFTERINVFDVAPGDYLVSARTDDPSGEGRFHIDTRRITIVD